MHFFNVLDICPREFCCEPRSHPCSQLASFQAKLAPVSKHHWPRFDQNIYSKMCKARLQCASLQKSSEKRSNGDCVRNCLLQIGCKSLLWKIPRRAWSIPFCWRQRGSILAGQFNWQVFNATGKSIFKRVHLFTSLATDLVETMHFGR